MCIRDRLRIGFDGLENQLSALQLARSSEQEEVDPDDFELTAGLSSAAAARFEGVTMRESHTKLESRSQREERERLLESVDKNLESHNIRFCFATGLISVSCR